MIPDRWLRGVAELEPPLWFILGCVMLRFAAIWLGWYLTIGAAARLLGGHSAF